MNAPTHINIDADEIGKVNEALDEIAGQPIRAAVIDELVALRASAKMAAETYSDAIAAQSEITGIRKGALRRYCNAREAGKVDELDMDARDLERLMSASS
ncbi:MAG: hypothetical protein K9L88_10360 [Chromatiaceae bacterium]|nr:hypothetical protein [Chromatiaceae bacterium]